MTNQICQLLGIKYPIFQGGMAWVANAALAAAVSRAGGLGIIGAGQAPADWVQGEIRKLKASTDLPFGVNIMLQSPYAADIAQVVLDEKVPVVTTGAGSPKAYIKNWQAVGTKVIPVIPNVKIALKMQEAGANAVIAEGMESGGHIGALTTLTLVPQVVDAVAIPVLAAGGIADGRGIAAVFALGAAGVQIGTAFLVAKETQIAQSYKAAVIKAGDTDTVITGASLGHSARCLKNAMTEEYLGLEASCGNPEQMEALGRGALRRAVEGDAERGSMMAGQIAGLVKTEAAAQTIIDNLVDGARQILPQIF